MSEKECIYREDAIKTAYDCDGRFCITSWQADGVAFMMNRIPAAPVREIVRGKWIETEERFEDDWGFTIVQHCACSVCSFTQSRSNTYTPGGEIRKSNFCPNCGADMRAEE